MCKHKGTCDNPISGTAQTDSGASLAVGIQSRGGEFVAFPVIVPAGADVQSELAARQHLNAPLFQR